MSEIRGRNNPETPWLEDQPLPNGVNPRDVSLSNIIEIDLSKARKQENINNYGNGDLILVLDLTGDCQLQINSKNASPIPLKSIPKIQTLFNDLYLTNEAQPGKKLILLLGGDFEGNGILQAESSFLRDVTNVTGTVGLKPEDLNIGSGNKNLGININTESIGLINAINNLADKIDTNNNLLNDIYDKLEENRLLLADIESNTAGGA
ncbi:MAG: hypothetical protein ACOCP8_06045 [archaeon]